MKLSVRARSKWTHKGAQDVIDEVVAEGKIVPKGGGLCIKLYTEHLSLSGRFIANLHLEWDEIELLGKTADGVPTDERQKLMETEIEELKAEVECWRRKLPPAEGDV